MAKENQVRANDLRALATVKKELVMVFGTSGDAKLTLRLADPRTDLDRDDVEPVMQQAITNALFVTSAGLAVTSIDAAYLQEVQQDKYI